MLALDLVQSWSFARPSASIRGNRQEVVAPIPRGALFSLGPSLRHRSSIMIDMDVSSSPSTRRASPDKQDAGYQPTPAIQEENDLFARKEGLGNLMKSAKQDVKVPEFDMNAFF